MRVTSNSPEAAPQLRYLGWLLIAWFITQALDAAAAVAARGGTYYWVIGAVAIGLIGLILSALFRAVRNGSATARLWLTIFAVVQVVGLVVGVVRTPWRIGNDLYSLIDIGIRVAVIAVVNATAVRTIAPQALVPQGQAVGPTHDHNWQPHGLVNDWVRCSICGEMRIEPGTMALVNAKPEDANKS